MAKLKVRITDIHEEDAFYEYKDVLLSKVFTIDPANVKSSVVFEGDWLQGGASGSKKDTYFFAGFKYEEIKDQESQTV
jgi:hypothetical protein